MTLEQRPELNRLIDPALIDPWEFRRRLWKVFLPLGVLCLVLVAEMILIGAWLRNMPLLVALVMAIGGSAPFLLFVGVLIEIRIRTAGRGKRVIQFKDDEIIIRSTSVRWEHVSKFQFEPVAGAPNVTKFTLFRRRPKGKRILQEQLAMESPAQVRELMGYLQKRKAVTKKTGEIVVLNNPSPLFEDQPWQFMGLMLTVGGVYLLYNGAPILLGLFGAGHHDSEGNSRFSPEQAAKLQNFIAQHFSSHAEVRHFFLTWSIVFIIAGVILIVWGRWMGRRRTPAIPVTTNT